MPKRCSRCGIIKSDPEDFYAQLQRDGVTRKSMSHCKDCHKNADKVRLDALSAEERAVYYEKMRARKLLATFGLTVEEYDEMLERQGGVCAICRQPEVAIDNRWTGEGVRIRRLAVDHDHETGKNRGLLCMNCNTKLGYFEKYGLLPALTAYVNGEVG